MIIHPLSRATGGLNDSENGCHFLTIFKKNIAFILKMYKTYIIDIYILIKNIFIQFLIILNQEKYFIYLKKNDFLQLFKYIKIMVDDTKKYLIYN
jgi:hypothetical protein